MAYSTMHQATTFICDKSVFYCPTVCGLPVLEAAARRSNLETNILIQCFSCRGLNFRKNCPKTKFVIYYSCNKSCVTVRHYNNAENVKKGLSTVYTINDPRSIINTNIP